MSNKKKLKVLILIILEVTLWAKGDAVTYQITGQRLNPYYTGSYSMRMVCGIVGVVFGVLILIILEVTLWVDCIHKEENSNMSVLILIILEVTLWES